MTQKEIKDVQKFLKKLAWLAWPFVLLFGFSTFVLLVSGELVPVDCVIQAQKNAARPILFGPAYLNPARYYKLKSTLERKPEVLALGNSRVMQIRSGFFRQQAVFYNAGGAVDRISDLNYFLDKIPVESQPKILLLGLDAYYFHPANRNFSSEEARKQFDHAPSLLDTWQYGALRIYKDYFDHKFSVGKLRLSDTGSNSIGMNARVNQNGFRNDGSYYYGKIIADPGTREDLGFRNTFRLIAQGEYGFKYSEQVSADSLWELERFLERCRLRKIEVIAFLPPYAHAVYSSMRDRGSSYAYLAKLQRLLPPLFDRFGYMFYDYSDLGRLASDDESIDGLHASEKAYARLFLDLSKKRISLQAYARLDYLNQRLMTAGTPYFVLEETAWPKRG